MPARSGFLPDRTVHLHPVGRCNLACLHCYAASSPRAGGLLAVEVLERALEVLRGEGYTVVSLSGGEPLLYPELGRLVAAAKALGFRVLAITNGTRVRPALDPVLAALDGVAVSFDGMASVHDRVRGRAGAFDAAVAALHHLRGGGVPTAAAYTVSAESLADVPTFAALARGTEVRALQLRPLVMAGRASETYAHAALEPLDRLRLFLVASALAEAYAGEMAVHVDLAHGRAIAADDGAYERLLGPGPAGAPLADVVNPLVVTPAGDVLPLTYDFPAAFRLGRLEALAAEGAGALDRGAIARLARVVAGALAAAGSEDGFLDWFAFCRDRAREAAALPA